MGHLDFVENRHPSTWGGNTSDARTREGGGAVMTCLFGLAPEDIVTEEIVVFWNCYKCPKFG